MLPSPSSSPHAVLSNRTNLYTQSTLTPTRKHTISLLPTPPEDTKLKRSFDGTDGAAKKRIKLAVVPQQDMGDNDVEMDDVAVVRRKAGKNTLFNMMNAMAQGRPGGRKWPTLPTRPILQSFVSSHKSDVYKCQSINADSFMTVPYACSYSHGAKRGGIPLLAVATEQGSVHIFNTSKRRDWDAEPPRTTYQPHANGIFDIKWNRTDNLIATSSGDQSTHISCPTSERTLYNLRGHRGTVKCVSWDPSHKDILSTGGRDGKICIWDMRVASKADEDGVETMSPVMTIEGAHGLEVTGRGRKAQPLARSVTSLLYPEDGVDGLISSGSFDGILRYWDLRLQTKRSRSTKPKQPSTITASPSDPTTLKNSRRPRGITSMTLGTGPSSGLIFAVGADSRIHAYSLPSLIALPASLTHPSMQTNSFYVQNAISPCGKWLGTGSTGPNGNLYLFDVSNTSRMGSSREEEKGVQLRGQRGEIGAIDWAEDCVASCADDGTVRVWRPDLEAYTTCVNEPGEKKWEWSWALEL